MLRELFRSLPMLQVKSSGKTKKMNNFFKTEVERKNKYIKAVIQLKISLVFVGILKLVDAMWTRIGFLELKLILCIFDFY